MIKLEAHAKSRAPYLDLESREFKFIAGRALRLLEVSALLNFVIRRLTTRRPDSISLSNAKMSDSNIQVGIRVRPLLPKYVA